MKNYIQDGDILAFTTPSGGVVSGQAKVFGTILGVSTADYSATTVGEYMVRGVFSLPKLSTDVVGEGVALYWDSTNSRLTVTSSGNTKVGYAASAAGNGDATVNILLGA